MKRIFGIIVVMVLAVSSLFAQNQQLPADPAVRVGKLENGMTYYIRHNELPAERAEFYLATNVGAIQETPDQDGLAHFLEHMCFNGTKNFPGKGILDYLQSIGASFGGNVNASTGVERTIYMLTNIPLVNETVVDSCILIMHDYSHFVLNEPEEIDAERGVIIAEKTQRNTASWRMFEKSQPFLYGDSKYNGCTVIGSKENLSTFKPESLVNFYQTWCRPDLQALIVVGDIDVDEVEAKIKSIFSDIPAPVNPKAKEIHKIPNNVEPIIGVLTDPELESVTYEIYWKSEPMPIEYNNTTIGLVNDLMKNIVSMVMAERFQELTVKPETPYLSAYVGIGDISNTCDATIAQASAKETEASAAFKALLTEVEKMKRFGFTEAEIGRAKDNIISRYESAAQKADTRKSTELVYPLISNFLKNEAYMDPATALEIVKQILPMLNSQMLSQVTSQLITDENMVVILTAPEKEGLELPTEQQIRDMISEVKASEIQANEEVVTATELLDASALKGAAVKKASEGVYGTTVWTLKNGVNVYLKPTEFEKDKISINLFKNGGLSLVSTEDLPSVEDNIWSLYQRNAGVAQFPATTLSKMLSGKNVSTNAYLSSLYHGISASSTVKDLEVAFQLLYLQFVQPRFDEAEYGQGITMMKSVLPNLVNQPQYKFQKAYFDVLWGNHPRRQVISEEIVAKADIKTAERIYKQLFKDAAGASVVIVGDFKIDEIKPLVEKYIGSLPKGKKATDWVDQNEDFVKGKIVKDFNEVMETPNVSVLRVLNADLPYTQENVAALNAVSYIMNMRFTTSLREKEGGTYGASVAGSMVNAPKQLALLQVVYDAVPDKADRLRELTLEGLETFAAEGPTESEFEMTINYLKKNIPEKKITNGFWASSIRANIIFGEEPVDEYEAAVNDLTPEKIQNMMKAILAGGNDVEVVMRPQAE